MCRLAGIAEHPSPMRKEAIHAMLTLLAHGGPDDEGVFEDDCIALGHRRLSIIDLSPAGHQPMVSSDGNLVITFNGEIYNYQTLRKELESSGKKFISQTDTEVILQAYLEWGTRCFDRFEGIFALALYDRRQAKLLLVRDHVGVKPLYYSLRNNRLVFSSEVRAFKAVDHAWPENKNWRVLFLAFGSLPQPATTLQEVYEMEPGSWLEVNLKNLSVVHHRYHSFAQNNFPTEKGSELEIIKTGVIEAVKKNLIADAPLGVFLSGGIDSSLLTLLADQFKDEVKSISINFDDAQYDEQQYQKMVLQRTKNVNHLAHRVTSHMFWDSLPDIWQAMDQPSNDGVNLYFVSQLAHRDGLKAVLSGLGADEVFGGYVSFERIKAVKYLRSILPFKKSMANVLSLYNESFKRLVFLDIEGPIGDYLFLRGIHTPDVIASLLDAEEKQVTSILREVPFDSPDNISDKEYVSMLELKIYMTNQLLKDTDVMGMWHGLEVRVPFLDIELLRKFYSIPVEKRYPHPGTKQLLTNALPGILPDEIVTRPKKGFTFPLSVWMKEDIARLKSQVRMNNPSQTILNNFMRGKIHWSKCWSLAVLNQFR
ncbi:MAG: Asparagine synthetase [glutamine-hydrolyzing] [Cytophagales bacterium]|jgi:asparagine synthase (glutamine-hydrolysing)|nr:asparagine synthase (glutamine-hydrolyzing) [Bacteroidota bacterium]MBS1980343.1 asparagine synthase (glutamine-hydrolyzing) [Bacteroidota bacterium]WHZ08872.1 MAG: Asparagine synthetase [glutamine-hydrolyzing] [Cytophagales bacterium]